MGRKRASIFEDVIEAVTLLPWWGGVLLALISYLWIHQIAAAPIETVPQSGRVGSWVSQMFIRNLAVPGQYFVPFLCLMGALGSAIGRWKRTQLFSDVAQSRSMYSLGEMSWREFEMLVGEAFRIKGYTVIETGDGADGGVDLILEGHGERLFVQCKQWRAYKVGVTVVRELYGVMAARGATGGYVVTSGTFTQEARDFAQGRNIELLDGPALYALISKVAYPESGRAGYASTQQEKVPQCPICNGRMIKRTRKREPNAGQEFWGCRQYPSCRGTRPLS